MLVQPLNKPLIDPIKPILINHYGPFSHIFLQFKELGIWEYIFRALIIAFIGWGIYNLFTIYTIHTDPEYQQYKMTSISDMNLALLACVIFMV